MPALDGARKEGGRSAGSNRALMGREDLVDGGVDAGLVEILLRADDAKGSKSPCRLPACCLGLAGAGA